MAKTVKIGVGGMTCNHCAMNVKQALATLPGVQSINVNLMDEEAVVETTRPLEEKEVNAVLTQAGYTLTHL